ncbi:hypothetical protein UlMin_009360 [Ulmus minor]
MSSIAVCNGLRQGDPISPYLFILCMEVLSRLINRKAEEGLIKGFRLSRHTPVINHLFFADDVFLLGKCSINEAFYFKSCLDEFCSWSGQSFNSQKSNIFFNRAANRQVSNLIIAMMGFSRILPSSSYLGLPMFHSGKAVDFNFLVEMLDSKLTGWKACTLSKAKKLTIINSVALSLPIYVMQSTKIPTPVCVKLDAHIRSFWWVYSINGRNPICLKAWDALYRPKSCGGIGFGKMTDFNKAFFSKRGWNLVCGTKSFCLDILRSRYLLGENFLDDDFIIQPGFWDINKLNDHFAPEDVRKIIQIVLLSRPHPDKWIWTPESNGKFSAHSTYLSANSCPLLRENHMNITLFASVLLDFIWKYQNDIIHGGSVSNPQVLFNSSLSFLFLVARWLGYSFLCVCPLLVPPSS